MFAVGPQADEVQRSKLGRMPQRKTNLRSTQLFLCGPLACREPFDDSDAGFENRAMARSARHR